LFIKEPAVTQNLEKESIISIKDLSMSVQETKQHLAAEMYEIVISRKIKMQKLPMLQIFMRIDGDGDGKVSKKDLFVALQDLWEIKLTDEQIDHIFQRSALLAPDTVKESRQLDNSPGSIHFEKMGYQEFSNYVQVTSGSRASSSSAQFGAAHIASSPERKSLKGQHVESRQAESSRAEELRKIVSNKIQQSIPATESCTGTTFSFLQMDTLRSNEITGAEFEDWLKRKNGLQFSDEEMKLVRGKWQKTEGLTLQEFDYFIHSLEKESRTDEPITKMVQRLSINQRDPAENENCDLKSDEELIWAFLNHFRVNGTTLTAGFHKLDYSNSSGLSAQDIRQGLKETGVNVSLQRSKLLTNKFVSTGGRMSKTGFVRWVTSAPKRG
jgi:Ca2+-binding EF-hand superfamily protein